MDIRLNGLDRLFGLLKRKNYL